MIDGRQLPRWVRRPAAAAALLFAVPALAAVPAADDFSSARAGFEVRVGGSVIPYRVFGLTVLPGEVLRVEARHAKADARFSATAPDGRREPMPSGILEWKAPGEPGLHPWTIEREGSGETMRLNVFVLVPLDRVRGERLNGYRIGTYPKKPLKGVAIYRPPRGFIEVTPENEDTLVSPHFRLKQFLCKQAGGYPKYLVLQERLPLKLEWILQEVNAAGLRCDTFHVMSGYRTPFYNTAIGNVRYSRHVWGGAADIFIDVQPQDDMMDDLNGDGRVDYRDAAVLYELIDGLFGDEDYKPFVGGLARYEKTAAHGPFVHVDVRGFRARWGT